MSEENVVPEVETVEAVAEVVAEPVVEKTVTQGEFDKLYFKKMQAERDNDKLKEEMAALQNQETKPVANEPKTLEQFDYDDQAYNDHQIAEQVSKQVAAQMQKIDDAKAAKKAETEQMNQVEKYSVLASEYAEQNPGYVKTIEEFGDVMKVSPTIRDAILNSKSGPALEHKLLSDPAMLSNLHKLSPIQAVLEIGRLEATLKPGVQKTAAPEPFATGAGGGTSGAVAEGDMSMEDYYAHYMEKMKNKA